MKTIVKLVLFIILFGPFYQVNAAEVKKGEMAIVPDFNWVEVLNLKNVWNGSENKFTFGDSCRILPDGIMTVVGELDETNLLVRYMTPDNREVFGADCPSGVIFKISKKDFLEIQSKEKPEQTVMIQAEQERRDQIARKAEWELRDKAAKTKAEQEWRDQIAKILEAENGQ